MELGDDSVTTDDFSFNAFYSNYLREYICFNPYSYELSMEGAIRYLEFTNTNGDKALYSNQKLTVNEQQFITASVFPNPVIIKLKIESSASLDNISFYTNT